MKNEPIVTVILPVYNGGSYLEDAIKSIQQQTFREWELLIIDDGSTDNSLKISQKFADDHRIHIVHYLKNRGLIHRLNDAIKKCRTKYIARQDADDISEPLRLQKQVDFLAKHSDYGLVASLFTVIDEANKVIKVTAVPLDDSEIKIALKIYNPITHGAVMLRREVIVKNKLQYKSIHRHYEDYALWLEMAKYTKFKILKTPLYRWRLSKSGITAKNLQTMIDASTKLTAHYRPLVDTNSVIVRARSQKNIFFNIDGNQKIANFTWMYQKLLIKLSVLLLRNNHYFQAMHLFYTGIMLSPLNLIRTMIVSRTLRPAEHRSLQSLFSQ